MNMGLTFLKRVGCGLTILMWLRRPLEGLLAGLILKVDFWLMPNAATAAAAVSTARPWMARGSAPLKG